MTTVRPTRRQPSRVKGRADAAARAGECERRREAARWRERAELADALVGVLSPCLLDADAAVRRGAAPSAGLLGQLLGAGDAQPERLLAGVDQPAERADETACSKSSSLSIGAILR